MTNGCPRCGKPVYLVDELRCLEKVWHKNCLRCQTCNRLLTILTYKGFDKQPYCEQHLPEARHTPVADSYATRHAKEAAKLQSLLEYRKEYEATKGEKISVADDVVTRRLLANARNAEPARRVWNWERKLAMDDDLEQVTAEDEVMAPAPEECIALGPTDPHQDQSQPPTHSEATSSCSADPADLLPHDEPPGKSMTEHDTIIEQEFNYSLLDEQQLETRGSSESLSGSVNSCSTQTTTCDSRSSMSTLSRIIEQDDCRRCQGPINPRTQIDYKNKAWHRKCFKCQLCGSPICFALQMERQVVPVCTNPEKKGNARSESRKTPDDLAEEEEIAREVRRALARPRTKPVALAPTAAARAAVAGADDANNANDADGASTAAGSGDRALPAEPTSEVLRRQQPDDTHSATVASADKRGVGDRASTCRSSSKASRYQRFHRAINVAYSTVALKLRRMLQSTRSKKKAARAGKSKARGATSFSASTSCSSLSSSASSLEKSTQLDATAHQATAPPRATGEAGAACAPVLDGSELDVEFELVSTSEDHVMESSISARLHVSLPMTSSPVKHSPTTAATMFESGMPDCQPVGGAPEGPTACPDAGVSSSAEPPTQAHSMPGATSFAGSCRDRFAPAAASLPVPTSSVLPSTDDALPESCSGQAALSAATSCSEGEGKRRATVKRRRAFFFPTTGIGDGAKSALQGHADSAAVQAAHESCSRSRDEEGSAAEQQEVNGCESAAGGGDDSSDDDDLNDAAIQPPLTFAEELTARGMALPTIRERSSDSEPTLDEPSMEFVPALPSLVVTESNAPGRYPPYEQGDLLIDVKPATGGFVVATIARSGDRGFVRVDHVRDPQRELLL